MRQEKTPPCHDRPRLHPLDAAGKIYTFGVMRPEEELARRAENSISFGEEIEKLPCLIMLVLSRG